MDDPVGDTPSGGLGEFGARFPEAKAILAGADTVPLSEF